MKEKELYDYLNNTSFVDIIRLVVKQFDIAPSSQNLDIYYRAKDLISLYPNIFSKYKIDKYIKENKLLVIKEGKERLFLKSNVEEFLKQIQQLQFNEINN